MQTVKNIIANIIPIVDVTVTKSTMAWMEALYSAGAVSAGPDGRLAVQSEVRQAIRAIHAILAGGEVSIEISKDGGDKYADLESKFDLSMDETSSAQVHRSADGPDDPPIAP